MTIGLSVLGGLWFPSTLLPSVVRTIGSFTPTNAYGDLSRGIALDSGPSMVKIAVLVGWLALAALIATIGYRRSGRHTV